MTEPIVLTGDDLTLGDVWDVAVDRRPVRLAESAKGRMDAARTLGMLLRTLGHEVRLAHDGAAALATIEADPPDVVLLDIGLPVVDGYTVVLASPDGSADGNWKP